MNWSLSCFSYVRERLGVITAVCAVAIALCGQAAFADAAATQAAVQAQYDAFGIPDLITAIALTLGAVVAAILLVYGGFKALRLTWRFMGKIAG